jgi:hypothetical protein
MKTLKDILEKAKRIEKGVKYDLSDLPTSIGRNERATGKLLQAIFDGVVERGAGIDNDTVEIRLTERGKRLAKNAKQNRKEVNTVAAKKKKKAAKGVSLKTVLSKLTSARKSYPKLSTPNLKKVGIRLMDDAIKVEKLAKK